MMMFLLAFLQTRVKGCPKNNSLLASLAFSLNHLGLWHGRATASWPQCPIAGKQGGVKPQKTREIALGKVTPKKEKGSHRTTGLFSK